MSETSFSLEVPEGEIPRLKLLAGADRAIVAKIADALTTIPPTIDLGKLAKAVAEKTGFDLPHVSDIAGWMH